MALYLHADDSIIYPEVSGQRFVDEIGVEWVAKIGDVMVPHWALMPGQRYEYLPKNKSNWHKYTQKDLLEIIPDSNEEVRFDIDGVIRIADIYSKEKNLVIEVQKSPMDAKEMKARVDFHKLENRNVIWIFHKDRLGRICQDDIYLPKYDGPRRWRWHSWIKCRKGVEEGRYSDEDRIQYWRNLYKIYGEDNMERRGAEMYVREEKQPITYNFVGNKYYSKYYNDLLNPPLLELGDPSFLNAIKDNVILVRAVRYPSFIHEDLKNVIVELYPHIFVKVVAVWDLNENNPERESQINWIREIYEMPISKIKNFKRIVGLKVYRSLEEALKTCSYYTC